MAKKPLDPDLARAVVELDGIEDVCAEFRALAELIRELNGPVHDDREDVARYERRSTYLLNRALQHTDELWRVVYGRGTGITPGRCLDLRLEELATPAN